MRNALRLFIAIWVIGCTIVVAFADWDNVGDAPSGTKSLATAIQWLSNIPHLALTTDAIWAGAKYANLGTFGVGGGLASNTITPNFCTAANAKFVLSSVTATLASPSCVNEGQAFTLLVQQNSAAPPPLVGASDLIASYGSYYHFSGGTKPTLSTTVNLWDIIQCTTLLSPGTATLIGVCSAITNPQ